MGFTRRTWLLSLVAAVTALCLFIGFVARSDSYAESLFVNLGAAVVVFLPLLYLQRVWQQGWTEVKQRVAEVERATEESIGELGGRVGEVQAAVREVSTRLQSLGAETDDAIKRQREDDLKRALTPAREAAKDPSFDNVFTALKHGTSTGATGLDVFVPVRKSGVTVQFGARGVSEHRQISVKVIPYDGSKHEVLARWEPSERHPKDLFLELDSRLRQQDPLIPSLETTTVLDWLFHTLELASELRHKTAGDPWDRPKTIELPTKHWLIAKTGLQHIGEPATVFERDEVESSGPKFPADGRLAQAPHADELEDAWAEAYARYTST